MSDCSCGDPRHDHMFVKRRDLKRMLNYCRLAEEKHYEEYEQGAKPKGHIYLTIRRLNKALEEQVV